MEAKTEAHAFLVSLEQRFRRELCTPSEMRRRIPEIREIAARDASKKALGK
jgi:hypothetical protein